jgi:4-amino-4-deoxy-L-arabinose transferase-like glycosyltransferase
MLGRRFVAAPTQAVARRSDKVWGASLESQGLWIALAAALVLGLAYALTVPQGLPYDEPSHWATVVYYAHHWTLPVLGHRGVTYEAQMGPVAYYVDAVVYRACRGIGLGASASFDFVRLTGVVAFAASALVLWRLVRYSATRLSVATAVLVFAANPMLLAMSASVQNDTLALLFAFLAVERVIHWEQALTPRRAVAAGGLAGLAILTKLTVWPVLIVVPVWLYRRRGRAITRQISLYVGAALAVCGWWFVRNQVLYHDLTARTAVQHTGAAFPPFHVHGVSDLFHIVEEFVTYLWVPTEYFRNTIATPVALKALLVCATAAIVFLSARRLNLRMPGWLVLALAIISIVTTLITYVAVQAVAPRTAYLALPLWFVILGVSMCRLPRWRFAVTAAFMVGLNVWTLDAALNVGYSVPLAH